ncbi:ABC transporter substrate-binding protein [Bradyrhizobium sp. 1.29L]
MRKRNSAVSRRHFLAGVAGALAAPKVMGLSRAVAKSNSITFATYGGTYQEILVETVINPFTKETEIGVNIVAAPDLAKIKAQLLTGNVEWDVADRASAEAAAGSKQGLWETLDHSMFDLADMAIPPRNDYVPFAIYAGGIAWNPKQFGAGKHPTNFPEFFDQKKFPGRRAFFKYAPETLSLALLADGVAPKDVYPLDLDRAFKALDRMKPSIAKWASASTELVTLAQSGEVDFTYTYSNRVKATNEGGSATPLAFSFEQTLFDTEGLAVLKGAPNKEGALKFVAFFLRPEVQARVMDRLGYVPVSKKAAPMLSAEARKWQPDLSNPNCLFIDAEYWAHNFDTVSRRFMEWWLAG